MWKQEKWMVRFTEIIWIYHWAPHSNFKTFRPSTVRVHVNFKTFPISLGSRGNNTYGMYVHSENLLLEYKGLRLYLCFAPESGAVLSTIRLFCCIPQKQKVICLSFSCLPISTSAAIHIIHAWICFLFCYMHEATFLVFFPVNMMGVIEKS